MKFSQPVCEAILRDLKDEVPYKISCESNGIDYDTFNSWLKYGARDIKEGKNNSYYAQFLVSVRNVQKNNIKYHVKRASESEKGHRGSEWILSTRHWQYFSPKAAEIEFNERLEKLEQNKAEEDEIKENKE
jgi:hypothetical protein